MIAIRMPRTGDSVQRPGFCAIRYADRLIVSILVTIDKAGFPYFTV
jgi:hypothetical protein